MRTTPPTPEQAAKADFEQIQSPRDNRAGVRPYRRVHVSLWDRMARDGVLQQRHVDAADRMYADFFHCHGSPCQSIDLLREVRGWFGDADDVPVACQNWKDAFRAMGMASRAVLECLVLEEMTKREIEDALRITHGGGTARIVAALDELAAYYDGGRTTKV